MPTGHTDFLLRSKEATAEDFILHCAQSLGVRDYLRVTPQGKVTVKSLNDYKPRNMDPIQEILKEIKRIPSLSNADVRACLRADRTRKMKNMLYSIRGAWDVRNRLTPILNFLQNWQPPTARHQKLKDFCIEQIQSTLRVDGGVLTDELEVEKQIKAYEEAIEAEYSREIEKEEILKYRTDQLDILFQRLNAFLNTEKRAREQHEDSQNWLSQLLDSFK